MEIKWRIFNAFNDELKNLIKELNSDFEKNHPTLTGQIKKLQNITDELESIHKKTTEGSLAGAALGAAGGITSIAGLCLAPFTFGASLALTGAGAAVGIVGGATGATCTITNMIKQKNLRETIEKIISDVQNTVKSIIEQLIKINDNIEETGQLEETMKQEGVTTARGATDISELKNEIGKVSVTAVKDMLVFVQAANVASARVDAAKAAYVAAQAANVARAAGAATGILSGAVFTI
ncbi:apolipo L3-like protein [Labeo rohita]|uniref:Apolipo L3-like protein n=1 Tax=Labeo rohita TaxID=84645 RepID=A0A498M683_LABRO|nr:apolipo L3-like protein [Labeo rohita]